MINAADLQSFKLFDCFDDEYLEDVALRCADVVVRAGEGLFYEGDVAAFYLVIDGTIELLRDVLRKKHVIASYSAGDFFGEIPLLLGSAAISSARAKTDARVARLDRQLFREITALSNDCKATLVSSMLQRIGDGYSALDDTQPSDVSVVGNGSDPRCSEIRKFLASVRTPYTWIDREKKAARAEKLLDGRTATRAVIVDAETRLLDPTNREIATAIGLPTKPRFETYDTAIVGAGPAGLAAAVYGASEGLRVLIIDRGAPGGQAGTSSRIENYLGFPGGISGDQLIERAIKQAYRFGADIVVTRNVDELVRGDNRFQLKLEGGHTIQASTVILATGVEWRLLDAPGVDRLVGRGITYGADRAEAPFVIGKQVFIVGAGNSAGQAAMFFSNYASDVTLLVRGESLRKSMSQYLVDQIESKQNINVELFTNVIKLIGAGCLSGIVTHNSSTGSTVERPAEALFLMIGAEAKTHWLPKEMLKDKNGFILTGHDVIPQWEANRAPFTLETSIPSILAVGDLRCGSVKRVSAGVGEGSMAVSFVHQLLALGAEDPRPAINSR